MTSLVGKRVRLRKRHDPKPPEDGERGTEFACPLHPGEGDCGAPTRNQRVPWDSSRSVGSRGTIAVVIGDESGRQLVRILAPLVEPLSRTPAWRLNRSGSGYLSAPCQLLVRVQYTASSPFERFLMRS